jgi:glycine/D-amino acid oxidase-like deaminating enzyme
VDAYGRERARRIWRFTEENVRITDETLDGSAFALERSGSVLAAGSPSEADRLRRSLALMAEDGIDARWLDAAGVRAVLGMEGLHGALVVPAGGALNPERLVAHLAAQSGAVVGAGWSVERVEPDGGGVRLRIAGGGSVRAPRALLALNAYLPQVLPDAARWVRPVRAQMLATAPVEPVLPAPVYSHDGYFYLRQRPDGRLLMGGARHLHAADEVGYEDATTPALQADLEAYLRRHLPRAGAPAVERRWSGTMGFSPDGLPVLAGVPGVPGAFVATGFTGHGMGYGARFGLLAARTLLGEADDAADLFAPDRPTLARQEVAASNG